MGFLNKLILFIGATVFSAEVLALAPVKEFSAQAVISVPQQSPRISRLFVSKKAVRNEMESDGQIWIEIIFPEQGRAVLINDAARVYRERHFTPQDSKNDGDPCAQILHATCEKKGTEKINGMNTEKWEIISDMGGQKIRTLHWIDIKRKLALREFFPDGTVAELKMIAKETINGRNTEKWQRTLDRPDGRKVTSYQWYDRELGIAIREELPGGYVRELKQIRVNEQPASLFEVPKTYQRIEDNTSPDQGALTQPELHTVRNR